MAKRIRVYNGEHSGANIVGFSGSLAPDELTQSFFEDRGYEYEDLGHDVSKNSRLSRIIQKIGSVSYHHIQIEPPLNREDYYLLEHYYQATITNHRDQLE